MPWIPGIPGFPESIKKRACRYLLQHYLGQFLQEKLHLDQLSVDLYNGTGHVNNVALDIWALNSMLDQAHAPMELVDGYIGSIVVSIPWSALLSKNCEVEIKGLDITLQPKYRTDSDLGNMTDSFYRSFGGMTTSMQLAEECLKGQENETQDTTSGGLFEGLEVFAQTIESVLSRVKVSLTDMVIRVEHLPENAKSGIGLEIRIDRIEYFDEITMGEEDSVDSPTKNKQQTDAGGKDTVFHRDSVTCKHFRATGINVYLEEFPEQLRTSPPGSVDGYPSGAHDTKGATNPINISCSPDFVTMTAADNRPEVNTEELKSEGPFLIGRFFGWQELKLRIRQIEHATVPKLDAECFLGSCSMFLTPHQVHLLTDFVSGLVTPNSSGAGASPPGELTSMSPHSVGLRNGNMLSPSPGCQSPTMPEKNSARPQNEMSPDYHDIDGDQFFSMDASRTYAPSTFTSPQYKSDDEFSEYGTSIYSDTTGYTQSVFSNSTQSRMHNVTATQPASKVMGGGHHYGAKSNVGRFPSSVPSDTPGRTRSEEDKTGSNHCHYQFQIRAMAITVLHINPLPPSTSPTHTCEHNKEQKSPFFVTPRGQSDVDGEQSQTKDSRSEKSKYLLEISEKYFSVCGAMLDEVLKTDIHEVRSELANVCCPHDHLRLTAAHINLSSDQKTASVSDTEVSLGRAEITECVFSDVTPKKTAKKKGTPLKTNTGVMLSKRAIHSEILVFSNEQGTPSPGAALPNVKIQISSHSSRRSTKNTLYVHLSSCESEVDISIVDRLSTLLYPPEQQAKQSSTTASLLAKPSYYSHVYADAAVRQAAFKEALADDGKEEQFNFNVSASRLKVNFRFPIADLRPEMERRPWYARSLRDETLVLDACDIAFITSSLGRTGGATKWNTQTPGSSQCTQEFEITVKDLHVLYSDEPKKPPKSFLRISQSATDMEPLGGPVDANSDLDCPHVKVTISPSQQENGSTLLRGTSATLEHHSLMKNSCDDEIDFPYYDDDFPMTGPQESHEAGYPTPFSRRKVIYNSEQMILPGDPSEIQSFMEHAISTSLVSIAIHLPAVNAFLVSKSFFENLYNRINNDILLWAPAAPRPHGTNKNWLDSRSHIENSIQPNSIIGLACTLLDSRADSNEDLSSSCSDSDDTSTEKCKSYLSGSRKGIKSMHDNGTLVGKQSLVAVTTRIGSGRVSAKCNTLTADGEISHSEHGEIVIMLENANIFNVASYNGNPLLDFVCVQAGTCSLYHKSSIPSLGSVHSNVERLNGDYPDHLDKVMGPCEDGIAKTFDGASKTGTDLQNMVTLAIKIETEELRPMKQCLVAAGINGVTLFHKFAKTGHSWLEQLIDFVDATDDKVLGYQPPSFITEIHLNVNNSAAVYHPVNMASPIDAVVTATSLSLSSNIVAGAPLSVLNIIVDEAKLYITDKSNRPNVELLQDYACVIDVNVFEICLKLSNEDPAPEKANDRHFPLIDFQASNNMIMLRTCADSCAALGALVRYLADDGDFACNDDFDSESDYPADVDEDMVGDWAEANTESNATGAQYTNNETIEEDEEEDDDLSDLMADAMEDAFQDAVSDFDTKKAGSAMTESMYVFSTSTNSKHVTNNPRASKNIMSQSVMVPNTGARKKKPTRSHLHHSQDKSNLYYSAFSKPGIRQRSDSPDDDEFCIIDDVDSGAYFEYKEPEVRYGEVDAEEEQRIHLMENHFKPTLGKIDQLQAPEHFPMPVVKYTLKELSCVWSMYGGSDFGGDESVAGKSKKETSGFPASPKARKSSPIHLKYNARKRSISFSKQGSTRDPTMLMEVHLTKVRCQFEQYPDDTLEATRTVVIVSDFEVKDKLQSSRINKFLYRFHSEASPRQAHAKALLVKALQIRPEGLATPTECRLRISLQPLRLNVDQDTLNFLTKFFNDITSSVAEENGSPTRWMAPVSAYETAASSVGNNRSSPKSQGTPYSSPVMSRPSATGANTLAPSPTVNNSPSSQESLPGARKSSSGSEFSNKLQQPAFFRELVFSPEVPIRLDYHGKRIDTEQGTFAGLLMGLGQLNCSQLKLKRVVHRHGLLGVDKLISYLLSEWAADIRANQLPQILGGVGPIHSVVQLFKGVRDLVYLPVEQYRKDGRLVRGLQKGATSFGTSTVMATLEITNRAIGLIQSAAETTYELVSPPELHKRQSHAQRNWRTLGRHAIRRQPADIREGMSNAFTVVRDGVQDTAGVIVRVAQKEHERKGVTGAVGGVLRHIPPALVRPVIMATEATTNVLSGIRNQIQPDAKQQDEDKWKNMEALEEAVNNQTYDFN